MMPFPHRVTIKRPQWTDSRFERWDGIETVAEDVPALVSPASGAVQQSEFGPLVDSRDLIFFPAGTDVRLGDIVVDAGGTQWQVIEPPRSYDNPITWTADHIEVRVRKALVQQAQ